MPDRLLACQPSALRVIIDKVVRMRRRLALVDSVDSGLTSLDQITDNLSLDGAQPSARLVADNCVFLPRAGLIDPLPYISLEHRRIVTDAGELFPSPVPGLQNFATIKGPDRREYIFFVVQQLRTRKVNLQKRIKSREYCLWGCQEGLYQDSRGVGRQQGVGCVHSAAPSADACHSVFFPQD